MGNSGAQCLRNASFPKKVANMLIGTYQHNMDAKGRVAVPAKFREDLGEVFYITKGLDGCLFALSAAEWQKLQDKMKAMPISKSLPLQRFFFSGAAEVETDKQGRILLPTVLREFAGLEKDVVLAGVGNRVEIWDKERWIAISEYDDVEEVVERMTEIGVAL